MNVIHHKKLDIITIILSLTLCHVPTSRVFLTALCCFRSHPPSTPARQWLLTAVSMTTTWSWLPSHVWHPPWHPTPSPCRPRCRTRGPRRGPVSGGSGPYVRTWTCWWATATWSTHTHVSPSRCPTCSSTPSTGACTPEGRRSSVHSSD